MILGGDFRQVLPVIRHANTADLIESSLKRSTLWPLLKIFKLHQNMRAATANAQFLQFLLKLRNGDLQEDENGQIEIS